MPNFNGTGPTGQGPFTGRGRGKAMGKGQRARGKGLGGSRECTCPKCGNKEMHVRGIPCSEKKCSKCGTFMRGSFCF